MTRLPLLPALVSLAAALAARAEEKPPPLKKVEGFVVDAKNVLQPNADLATEWVFEGGGAEPAEKAGWRADAKGRFATELPWRGPVTVLAMDAKREKGALLVVTEEALAKPITVRLLPLVRVKAKIECREAGLEVKDARLSIETVPGEKRIGGGRVAPGDLALRLPAGSWKFVIRHDSLRKFKAEHVLPQGRPEFDAGRIVLEPTVIAVCEGRELPDWRFAEARRAPKTAQLRDYRGKWVLLEFWRSGCPSCRGWVIPGLRDFHEKYKDQADRFQILAFGQAEQATLEETDAFLDKETKGAWTTAALPFPVLLDFKEKGTIEDWGVSIPTQLLIDPEGKVVKGGSLEMLEKILRDGR